MAGAADRASEAKRADRLSGLVPLMVMAIIAFLFMRSCVERIGHSVGLGHDDQEDRDLSRPPATAADEEATQADSLTTGVTTAEEYAELATMLEPIDPECPEDDEDGEHARHLQWTDAPPICIEPEASYAAILHTSRGDIEIELDADNAPVNVNNFVFLARWHFYDGLDFHVVHPRQSIQAGLPLGMERQPWGPGYSVPDELPDEDDQPWYPLFSVIMGNDSTPNSAGSVFVIVTGTAPMRSPIYSRFGQITDPESRVVVDAIDATGIARAGHDGSPSEPTVIQTVTIIEELPPRLSSDDQPRHGPRRE